MLDYFIYQILDTESWFLSLFYEQNFMKKIKWQNTTNLRKSTFLSFLEISSRLLEAILKCQGKRVLNFLFFIGSEFCVLFTAYLMDGESSGIRLELNSNQLLNKPVILIWKMSSNIISVGVQKIFWIKYYFLISEFRFSFLGYVSGQQIVYHIEKVVTFQFGCYLMFAVLFLLSVP